MKQVPPLIDVKMITPEHAKSLWKLRLEGLTSSPESFGSTYEEASNLPMDAVVSRVSPSGGSFVLGAFTKEGIIVGMVGFKQEQSAKFKHKGNLWGMYLRCTDMKNGQ